MSDFISVFVTLTKLDGLRTKVGVLTIDRLEEIVIEETENTGTRIVQEHTYVDVSEDIDTVEATVAMVQMELAAFDKAIQEHNEGDDWKNGPPEEI